MCIQAIQQKVFPEGGCLRSGLDKISHLMQRIKEIVIRCLKVLCPCFFSSKKIQKKVHFKEPLVNSEAPPKKLDNISAGVSQNSDDESDIESVRSFSIFETEGTLESHACEQMTVERCYLYASIEILLPHMKKGILIKRNLRKDIEKLSKLSQADSSQFFKGLNVEESTVRIPKQDLEQHLINQAKNMDGACAALISIGEKGLCAVVANNQQFGLCFTEGDEFKVSAKKLGELLERLERIDSQSQQKEAYELRWVTLAEKSQSGCRNQ